MTILSDKQIRQLCQDDKPMITPFLEHQVAIGEAPITSRGISGHGYDLSLGRKIRRQTAGKRRVVDPCNFDPEVFSEVIEFKEGEQIILQPGEFILGCTPERMIIPSDVLVICMEKSTLARSNIQVTVTPMEAGWEGYLTLEIINRNKIPAILTVGMGITQAIFFRSDKAEVDYASRAGKYQDQPCEPVIPRAKHKQEASQVIDPDNLMIKPLEQILEGIQHTSLPDLAPVNVPTLVKELSTKFGLQESDIMQCVMEHVVEHEREDGVVLGRTTCVANAIAASGIAEFNSVTIETVKQSLSSFIHYKK